jgi:16S rRNA (adenine1518-N6/adenine1519-N6)-dimethyltransferase
MRKAVQKPTFAKKSLGQNFLTHSAYIERIVAAADLSENDTVIEIGPGRGALTEKLVEIAGQVIAIEFDRELAAELKNRSWMAENLTVIEADVLQIDFDTMFEDQRPKTKDQRSKLVANLPYNISTAILQRLFDVHDRFEMCVLMFQREVVERITAPPGSSERGYLTVGTELHFESEKLFDIPPSAFRPAPKVWSSVVRLTPKEIPPIDVAMFKSLAAAGFAHKRKTIANNLNAIFANAKAALARSEINPMRRAETLTLEEWLRLTEVVSSKK